jgi:hypothetical protein
MAKGPIRGTGQEAEAKLGQRSSHMAPETPLWHQPEQEQSRSYRIQLAHERFYFNFFRK